MFYLGTIYYFKVHINTLTSAHGDYTEIVQILYYAVNLLMSHVCKMYIVYLLREVAKSSFFNGSSIKERGGEGEARLIRKKKLLKAYSKVPSFFSSSL